MKRHIPAHIIARADLLIAASLQTQLLQIFTGLTDKLQTPQAICALIKGVGNVTKPKRGRK